MDPTETGLRTEDCIVLHLDSHLEVLASGFSLPQPAAAGQFTLFPALDVSAEGDTAVVRRVRR